MNTDTNETETDTEIQPIPIVISARDLPDGADVIDIPLVVAFDANGPCSLTGDTIPENCDHAGYSWSDCLDIRCGRCGARLFIPARHLANRSEQELEDMHALWVRAGWPRWNSDHWYAHPARWTIIAHPLFDHLGGLAVRNDRLDSFSIPDNTPYQPENP